MPLIASSSSTPLSFSYSLCPFSFSFFFVFLKSSYTFFLRLLSHNASLPNVEWKMAMFAHLHLEFRGVSAFSASILTPTLAQDFHYFHRTHEIGEYLLSYFSFTHLIRFYSRCRFYDPLDDSFVSTRKANCTVPSEMQRSLRERK